MCPRARRTNDAAKKSLARSEAAKIQGYTPSLLTEFVLSISMRNRSICAEPAGGIAEAMIGKP